MSGGYTKLFSSITDSTIWQAPDATRLVWITMLAIADQNGYVGASVPGLAARARVSLEDCVIALDTFKAPDPWSRTEDFEGRRITDADGGWILLNHAKYRAMREADDRREQARLAMQRLRAERKQVLTVNDVSHGEPRLAQAEAEASTEASKKKKAGASSASGSRLPADWQPDEAGKEYATQQLVNWKTEAEAFRDYWHAKAGKEARKADWNLTWKTWCRRATKTLTKASTASMGAKAALRASETPLERSLGHIRQQYQLGAYGEGEDAVKRRDNEIKTATLRHRKVA